MNDEFERSKGQSLPSKLDSVNDTARAEIENTDAHDQAMGNHMQQWAIEKQRLAHQEHAVPDFDLGSKGHRDLLSEYEERRTDWERKADQIDDQFTVRRDYIRNTGQTLSDEFAVVPNNVRKPGSDAAPADSDIPVKPSAPADGESAEFETTKEQGREKSLGDEFAVSDRTRTDERSR